MIFLKVAFGRACVRLGGGDWFLMRHRLTRDVVDCSSSQSENPKERKSQGTNQFLEELESRCASRRVLVWMSRAVSFL